MFVCSYPTSFTRDGNRMLTDWHKTGYNRESGVSTGLQCCTFWGAHHRHDIVMTGNLILRKCRFVAHCKEWNKMATLFNSFHINCHLISLFTYMQQKLSRCIKSRFHLCPQHLFHIWCINRSHFEAISLNELFLKLFNVLSMWLWIV